MLKNIEEGVFAYFTKTTPFDGNVKIANGYILADHGIGIFQYWDGISDMWFGVDLLSGLGLTEGPTRESILEQLDTLWAEILTFRADAQYSRQIDEFSLADEIAILNEEICTMQ